MKQICLKAPANSPINVKFLIKMTQFIFIICYYPWRWTWWSSRQSFYDKI